MWHLLNLRERLDITAEEKFSCDIESIAKEEIRNIHDLAVDTIHVNFLVLAIQRPAVGHGAEKGIHMRLKAVQITDSVASELRSNKLSAVVPHVAIRGKDAVAKKVLPIAVEGLTLAVVVELGSQHGFDILLVTSEDDGLVYDANLGCPALGFGEQRAPIVKILICARDADTPDDKVKAWNPYQPMPQR